MSRSNRPDRSDESTGAETATSPFRTTSSVETTRNERLRKTFDESVAAPFRVMWADKRARFGFIVVGLFFLIGTVGVEFIHIPRADEGPHLVQPFTTLDYPLGTDALGKDLLASLVHATPAMLKMITAGAVFSAGIATIWGTVAGYKGGRVDSILMAIADVVMTIPGLPLIIVLAAILEPRDPFAVGVILSINTWAGFSRALRSQVLTIRSESYVEAARAMGLSTPTILVKDILPNVMPLVMVNFVTSARRVIISSVGLYFLGILPFTTLNWGVMMNLAYRDGAMRRPDVAHWFIEPMVTIIVLSLGLILLGQGMDRVFNPRIRARHTKTDNDQESPTDTVAATDGGRQQ